MKYPPPSFEPSSIVHHCSRCGRGRILANGFHASGMTFTRQMEVLSAVGWQVAPVLLCRSCACPMEVMEKIEWRDIKDYNAAQRFAEDMREKYGASVDKFLSTKPEDETNVKGIQS